MPLVSIITPTYNAEAWIGRAISSVLAQTIDDVEMIIVDDGSTDGTSEVIRAYQDGRVRMLSQDHQERSAARNTALSVASGEYVAFLDADDWWASEKLERQLALFKANNRLGLAYCGLQQVGPDGHPLRLFNGLHTESNPAGAYIAEQLLMSNIGGPGSTMMMPRRVAEETGEFRSDLVYVEDWDFCLRIASRYQVGFVPDVLAFYQAHGSYLPAKLVKLNMPDKVVQVISGGIELAGLNQDSDLARKALANAYFRGALVLAGVADHAGANERFNSAIALYPKDYTDRTAPVAQKIGYYANSLYDTLTPLDEAVRYVESLFDNLSGPAALMATARRSALGWTNAVHAFEGIALDQPERVRDSFWKAIAYDPSWLRNYGLISHGIKSWFAYQKNLL